MANNQAIKAKIKSVNSTSKITRAMEMVSNAKLLKHRSLLVKNSLYNNKLQEIVFNIISKIDDEENIYKNNQALDKKLYVVYTSDLGLCGGYNSNVFKYLKEFVSKQDIVYIIGDKGYQYLLKNNFNVINPKIKSDNLEYEELNKIASSFLQKYLNKEISEINIIYTKYVNNVSFEVDLKQVLPISQENTSHKEVELDPNKNDVLDNIIPYYISNAIYRYYLEAKTSEYGSRRFAMENASNNASEIKEKLTLEYNQARQAAITQEITEIVSGANAL